MVTAGLIHYVLNLLRITVHIRDVCVFLAPVFSGLTAISTFLLTRELWNQGAGLLAACFIAIVPGYISRSVAGSFDNEGIAIFALQFTYYLWVCRAEPLLLAPPASPVALSVVSADLCVTSRSLSVFTVVH